MRANKSLSHFLSLFFLLLLTSHFSHAEFINFDDIERINDPDNPFWADQPITDHYSTKGLLIDGGYLNKYFDGDIERTVSGPNYLQGGPYFSLTFIGKLPAYVSLIVTSSHEDVVFLDAACGDGSILSAETPGWAGPDKHSPFKAKNLVTFASDFGISNINISAFYFLRNSAMIDDLKYHYAVPEPKPIVLFSIGLLLLIFIRMSRARD